ncbi:MAG: argininosuccinate synthase, partial [Abditibacteriota bacterium]|nr:argininosuccinate synthase [Abditibacteriota bacterium]
QRWSRLVYDGLWFDPLKEDLDAFINNMQPRVTGTATLRLYKGSCTVVGRKSDFALYNEALASFDDKSFNQAEAAGVVKLHGLQARMYDSIVKK